MLAATCHIFRLLVHEHLDEHWRIFSSGLGIIYAKLAKSVGAHRVDKRVLCDEYRMVVTTANLADCYIVRAALWHGIHLLSMRELLSEAKLAMFISTPRIDLGHH